MPRLSRPLLALPAGIALAGFTPDVLACGGLFCNIGNPVVQTGEGIVFAVDRTAGTVDAVINIQYQGSASEFAWVLPLQSAPSDVRVAPAFLFTTMNQLTAPRFNMTVETKGECALPPASPSGGTADAGAAFNADASAPSGVQVLSREAVGPYDSVVIQSSDPEEMRTWLETNGYAVTDEMMEAVVPYVAKGDALLALKLLNGKSAGDIQPIWVIMEGNEVCVPIRLTAIAAIEDMDITTLVLSNEGRAIPENYFHVDLNLTRIDWTNGGSNYRQLVAEAADQGSGNAFVTEYAGSARIFDQVLHSEGRFSREPIEAQLDAGDLVNELQRQGLTIHPEVAAILLEAIGPDVLTERGVSPQQFSSCPGCFSFQLDGVAVSSSSVAADVWSRVVEPLSALQDEFDSFATATRLYTLISPEEMMIDPDFAFRDDLPEISNVHRARGVVDCSGGVAFGEAPMDITIEETGQVVSLRRDENGVFDDSYLDALPAAIKVEQLAQGLVVEDHTSEVASALERHRRQSDAARKPGDGTREGCRSAGGSASAWSAALLVLVTLTAIRRAGRRKR